MFDNLREWPPAPPEDIEQLLADYARIVDALDAGAPVDELPPPPEPEPDPAPWSAWSPSGWLTLGPTGDWRQSPLQPRQSRRAHRACDQVREQVTEDLWTSD